MQPDPLSSLFVGYSLRDEDFHELIHEVRAARGESGNHRPLGTLLTLHEDSVERELWGSDLHVVAMTGPKRRPGDDSAAARQLEMFVDLVAFLSTTSAAFLLDPTYDELSDDEQEVRSLLRQLVDATSHPPVVLARASKWWAAADAGDPSPLAATSLEAPGHAVIQGINTLLRELIRGAGATLTPSILMMNQRGARVVHIDSFQAGRALPRLRPRRRRRWLRRPHPTIRRLLRAHLTAIGYAFRAQPQPDIEALGRRP
jgi:hypothetical protein